MNSIEKRCIVEVLGARYRQVRKQSKGAILDDLSVRLGVGRRQAKRLLGSRKPGRPRNPERRGRPSKYRDPEFIAGLRSVWRITKYMCGRHLKAAIPDWLPHIEAERGKFHALWWFSGTDRHTGEYLEYRRSWISRSGHCSPLWRLNAWRLYQQCYHG